MGTPRTDPSDYHPNQTLRVLIGTRTGSGEGYSQRAFFFLDGHYLGTDSKQSSALSASSARANRSRPRLHALPLP